MQTAFSGTKIADFENAWLAFRVDERKQRFPGYDDVLHPYHARSVRDAILTLSYLHRFCFFLKMGENNSSTLRMDASFLENGVKISNNRKKQGWFVSWEYIYFLLIHGFRDLQMTGKIYVFTNIRIRVNGASKASWLHHCLSSKVSTTDIFGRKNANSEGFSVDLIQGPQVDFFKRRKPRR